MSTVPQVSKTEGMDCRSDLLCVLSSINLRSIANHHLLVADLSFLNPIMSSLTSLQSCLPRSLTVWDNFWLDCQIPWILYYVLPISFLFLALHASLCFPFLSLFYSRIQLSLHKMAFCCEFKDSWIYGQHPISHNTLLPVPCMTTEGQRFSFFDGRILSHKDSWCSPTCILSAISFLAQALLLHYELFLSSSFQLAGIYFSFGSCAMTSCSGRS